MNQRSIARIAIVSGFARSALQNVRIDMLKRFFDFLALAFFIALILLLWFSLIIWQFVTLYSLIYSSML